MVAVPLVTLVDVTAIITGAGAEPVVVNEALGDVAVTPKELDETTSKS